MEKFQGIGELLENLLWDKDIAAASEEESATFYARLKEIENLIAARLVYRGPLDQQLTARKLRSIKNFLVRISEEESLRKWGEKVSQINQLRPKALAVAAVLCSGEKFLRNATDTVRAICQSAQKIAEWSPWPDDERLMALVREYQRAGPPPNEPDESQRTSCTPLALECSTCGTALTSQGIRGKLRYLVH